MASLNSCNECSSHMHFVIRFKGWVPGLYVQIRHCQAGDGVSSWGDAAQYHGTGPHPCRTAQIRHNSKSRSSYHSFSSGVILRALYTVCLLFLSIPLSNLGHGELLQTCPSTGARAPGDCFSQQPPPSNIHKSRWDNTGQAEAAPYLQKVTEASSGSHGAFVQKPLLPFT